MAKAKQGPEKHTAGTKFIILQAEYNSKEYCAFNLQRCYEFKSYEDACAFLTKHFEDGVYAIFELKSVHLIATMTTCSELK